MQMQNEEIVRSYRQAKRKREQITILAQLNACTEDQIYEILHAAGLNAKRPKHAAKAPAKPVKANTAAELLGQEKPDFTALSARVSYLVARRREIDKEMQELRAVMQGLIDSMAEVRE